MAELKENKTFIYAVYEKLTSGKRMEKAFHVYENEKKAGGVPIVAQWLMNLTRNHEVAGSIPDLAQWVVGYSSDSTPSLGTSICCRCGPRKGKKKKKKKKKRKESWNSNTYIR